MILPTVTVQLQLTWDVNLFLGFNPFTIPFRVIVYSIPGLSQNQLKNEYCDNTAGAHFEFVGLSSNGQWNAIVEPIGSQQHPILIVGKDNLTYGYHHPFKAGGPISDQQSMVIPMNQFHFQAMV